MKKPYLHIISTAIVAIGLTFIAFLYWSQPKTLAEVTTKGSVAIGTYSIDKTEFERGVSLFRTEDYIGSRVAFDKADPEKRDAATQFFVAYSYYRQGWGRVSNDDALFTEGLKAADRVIAIDANYRSTDSTLTMRAASELKAEFEGGLKLTPSDFNPLKLTRERK